MVKLYYPKPDPPGGGTGLTSLPLSPQSDDLQGRRDQLEEKVQEELVRVKQERDQLAQDLDSLQQQLNQKTDSHQDLSQELTTTKADLAAKTESHGALLQKLEATEQKLAAALNEPGGGGVLRTWWAKLITGLVVAAVTGSGGFTLGHRSSTDQKTAQDLTTKLANSERQVQDISKERDSLKEQLNRASVDTGKASADLAAKDIQLKQQESQLRLTKNLIAAMKEDVKQRTARENDLQQKVAGQAQQLTPSYKYNGLTSRQIDWKVQLPNSKNKPATTSLVIDHDLPGVPCTVWITSHGGKAVSILEPPGEPNRWKKITLLVEGNPNSTVTGRVTWNVP
jgi:DNA repair exonuclease SbcCD ATPase subunit